MEICSTSVNGWKSTGLNLYERTDERTNCALVAVKSFACQIHAYYIRRAVSSQIWSIDRHSHTISRRSRRKITRVWSTRLDVIIISETSGCPSYIVFIERTCCIFGVREERIIVKGHILSVTTVVCNHEVATICEGGICPACLVVAISACVLVWFGIICWIV